ncbi:GrpB domain protein [Cordyceps militaris]|uniref:GrpB domain protein n=1 Tax=Cordyceps militaris TaxID=73501 RepID=A0A2H4SGY8_CORMI|nr:GrpB domain protein [Cordyceps militaris]
MAATEPKPTVEEILQDYQYKPEQVEHVSPRREGAAPLAITEAQPSWASRFAALEARIRAALGASALAISHVGSTSVPGLPAKDIIDIDLTVGDVDDEASYAPALEAQGFHFRSRERSWHGHRFFLGYSDNWCNLHVWGPGCPETRRHLLMRDWLRAHAEDCEAYAAVKREAAAATNEVGGNGMDYNLRKEGWIRELLHRIFVAEGYITEDGQPIARD